MKKNGGIVMNERTDISIESIRSSGFYFKSFIPGEALKTLLLLLALTFGTGAAGQVVFVVDKTTRKPLQNVSIYSQQKAFATVTGENGRADISKLEETDSIAFQKLGYKLKFLSYSELQSKNFKVSLSGTSFSLDEMVVSASRWEQEVNEIPNVITTIDASEIAFKNPQTAADLLGETDQVYIQKSQLGGGSPMIRGFSTNRVLLVVDGVRMNNAIFRSGNLQNVISLDANAIEMSEVIFGPGSVIYGSDAIGGVMDFHTLEADLSSNDDLHFSGNAVTRYASANTEKTGHSDFNLGWKNVALRSSISYSDFGDQRMGSNGPEEYLRPAYVQTINGQDTVIENEDPRLQVPTGYNQLNLMQKVKYRPSDALEMGYAFHYSNTSNVPRYDRLIIEEDGVYDNAEWYYGPQQWNMHHFNAIHRKPNAIYDRARLVAAFQQYEESRHDRDFGSDIIRHRVENVDAWNVNLDMEKAATERTTFFYGAEAVLNTVHSAAEKENIVTGKSNPTSTRYPDGSQWQSYSAYATVKSNVSDKITLLGGARYSHVFIHAPFDTTFFNFPFQEATLNTGAFNGSAGLVYRPTDKWKLNLNLSSGFRAPNIDDVGKVFDSEPGTVVVPNADLKPEFAYNAEAGIEKTFADDVRLSVTGFYTLLNDALLRRDYTFNGQDSILYDGTLSQVQAIQNAGKARVYGVQTTLEVNLVSGLRWQSSFNWQQGFEVEGDKVALRHAAPAFGTSHLIYQMEKVKLDLYGVFNGQIAYEDLAPTEQGKPHIYATNENGNPYSPAWWTLNFKAGLYLNEHFSITTGIENILNKRYRPYSSGIAAPGRNFIIALRGRI